MCLCVCVFTGSTDGHADGSIFPLSAEYSRCDPVFEDDLDGGNWRRHRGLHHRPYVLLHGKPVTIAHNLTRTHLSFFLYRCSHLLLFSCKIALRRHDLLCILGCSHTYIFFYYYFCTQLLLPFLFGLFGQV